MKIFNKSEWKKVKLEDICDILDSRRIPISEEKRIKGKYPYYGANGIQGYINDYIFDEELVLLAEDGGNFGSKIKPIAYKINGKTWVNNHAHVLKAKNEIISTDFLLYSLMFYDVTKLITGTTRKKLTRTGMGKITLFIPNLDMQEKITNYLQEIEKFISLRKNQLNYLKELVKSLFTRMFGSPENNEKKWRFCTLKDISLSKGEYGSNKPAVKFSNGYRYIRITDIDDKGQLKQEKVSPSFAEGKYIVRKGDILFARSGATVGKNYIHLESKQAIYGGYLIKFSADVNKVINKYVYYCVNDSRYEKFVFNMKSNASQPNINAQQYSNFQILLPPLHVQQHVVNVLDKFDTLVNDIKEGLPKEIEHRQKQYEYWREQL